MWPVYAFNNYFANAARTYPIVEQYDLLKALGYNQTYHSVGLADPATPANLKAIATERRRTGLGLAAIYTACNLANPPADALPPSAIIEALEPGDTFELALSRGWKIDLSLPAHDEAALAFLKPLLALARSRGVTISLYHHYGFWLERIEDCVRLAALADDPALRVTFCGYHWYACDRTDLAGKLRLAAPWLRLVNLCGARPSENFSGALPASIEPVGDGEFPLAEFIAGLRAIGYAGPVGFQGYKIAGTPEETLPRSLAAFRRAEAASTPSR